MSEIKLKEKDEPVWRDEIRFATDQTIRNKKTRTYAQLYGSLRTFGIHYLNRGKNLTYKLIHKEKKVRSNELGKNYEKETILHELDRQGRTYNQRRTNELRGVRANVRETAEEVRREQRTSTSEQSEIRPTRRDHEQRVKRGTDHQQELSP